MLLNSQANVISEYCHNSVPELNPMTLVPDCRQYAPATQRNRLPILEILLQVLPPDGTVLEIASGTGEHGAFFASRLQPRGWLPSDHNPIALKSIAAWRDHSPVPNLYPPLELDVQEPVWPVERGEPLPKIPGLDLNAHPIRAIVNINMIHIAPWSACLGLMAGAERLLPPGGILYLYGPFKQGGRHTAPSNADFDASLKAQDSTWGVRDLEEVVATARDHKFVLSTTHAMPAHNLSVTFRAEA